MPITNVARTGADAAEATGSFIYVNGYLVSSGALRNNIASCWPRMLSSIYHRINKDAAGSNILTLIYGGSGSCLLRIDGADLQTWPSDTNVPAIIFDLRNYTIGELQTAIIGNGTTSNPGIPGWDCVLNDSTRINSPATLLVDTTQDISSTTTLYYSNNLLWCLLKPIAVTFDSAFADMRNAVQQIDPRLATGIWLDIYGNLFGLPRPYNANSTPTQIPDSVYRQQIIYAALTPRNNNIAIQQALLNVLGISASVVDAPALALKAAGVSNGTARTPLYSSYFTINPTIETFAKVPPAGTTSFAFNVFIQSNPNNYSNTQIQAFLNTYKSPGVLAIIS